MSKADYSTLPDRLEKIAIAMETRVGAPETAAARRAQCEQLEELRKRYEDLQNQTEAAQKAYVAHARITLLDLKRDISTLRRYFGSDSLELRHFGIEPRFSSKRKAKKAKPKVAKRKTARAKR
jgi:aminoglycoside phosphotransferase (APT) family kinase protein